MVHAALLLLMLEAVHTDLVFNHQPEAQHPKSSTIQKIAGRLPQLPHLKAPGGTQQEGDAEQAAAVDRPPCLLIPWTKPPAKRFKEILLPAALERHRVRPIKFERCAALLKSIARGRAWLEELVAGTATIEQIAARQKCSVRHINMTISMAFIAPALVKAAIEGRLPRGIGVAALRDAPAEWSLQFERLGLAQGRFSFLDEQHTRGPSSQHRRSS
jgi:hypothetical protein